VRNARELGAFADATVERFGRIDALCANAGIIDSGSWDVSEAQWDLMMDVNLKGVWLSCRAVIPQMIKQGSGVIACISSVAGLAGYPNNFQYGVAKHGVIGLMRYLAVELAPHNIRVNAVCPTGVETPMILNQPMLSQMAGDDPEATRTDAEQAARHMHLLAIPWVEMQDVSNALLWLVSEEARYVTGISLPIDAGATMQPPGIPSSARHDASA
jgi:NAD(P)-dependent dehydrogenase (short-subunit alcohol dehydrogenase family)